MPSIARPRAVVLLTGALLPLLLLLVYPSRPRPAPAGEGDAAARTYPDHTRVMYYLDDAGQERPVRTADDWARRRRDVLAGMQAAMGPLPDRGHLPPLDVRVTGEAKGDGFTR